VFAPTGSDKHQGLIDLPHVSNNQESTLYLADAFERACNWQTVGAKKSYQSPKRRRRDGGAALFIGIIRAKLCRSAQFCTRCSLSHGSLGK
jgi:hypothetical protein